jgi:hypothetical protein
MNPPITRESRPWSLTGIVAETNRAVDLRNRVLPDEERVKQEFRSKLKEVASQLKR